MGPVFNDTSCAACHAQGGLGGSGRRKNNVQVITVGNGTSPGQRLKLHPGFDSQSSVVLHRFGVEQRYESWRDKRAGEPSSPVVVDAATEQLINAAQRQFQGQANIQGMLTNGNDTNPFGNGNGNNNARGFGGWSKQSPRNTVRPAADTVVVSERNSMPLFGDGLIDEIPDATIEAIAVSERQQSPRTAGRVLRVKGKIGRFGWHAQQATLADFTLTACAVELGLNVPDHPQAGNPIAPKAKTTGLDMTAEQCAALVGYVSSLPRPQEPRGRTGRGRGTSAVRSHWLRRLPSAERGRRTRNL